MNSSNELDPIDRKILTILQEDGRITNVKLATEVKLSPPTVLERVRKLEERGVIQRSWLTRRYWARDASQMSPNTTAPATSAPFR